MAPSRTSETAADLRERIVATAAALLETDGLAALSMREVARRAGVTHQAPYHHFADRESILAELVTRGFDELASRLARANERPVDAEATARRAHIVASGSAYVGFALDNPGLFRIMFRTDVCDASRFPVARQAGENAYGELLRMVAMVHGPGGDATLPVLYWSTVHGLAGLLVDGPVGQAMPGAREQRGLVRETLARLAASMVP